MVSARSVRVGERGSVTLWLLGLSVMLLGVGALSVELWHAVSHRQALVGVADAAAYAAASGLDEAVARERGQVRLAPARARRLAAAVITAGARDRPVLDWDVRVASDGRAVTVTVEGRADSPLLGLLVPGTVSLPVRVTASAEPRRG